MSFAAFLMAAAVLAIAPGPGIAEVAAWLAGRGREPTRLVGQVATVEQQQGLLARLHLY